MIVTVKVIPGSRKNSLEMHEGVLKVKIKAPPDKGKANEELIEFLSESFSIPKSEICILSGHTSKLKKVKLPDGPEIAAAFKKLVAKDSPFA